MSSILNKISGGSLGVSGLVALALVSSPTSVAKEYTEVLTGKVISVAYQCTPIWRGNYTGVSAVVKVSDKYVLAVTPDLDSASCIKTSALIKSAEKEGGDIVIHGHYTQNKSFILKKFEVNGIYLTFK